MSNNNLKKEIQGNDGLATELRNRFIPSGEDLARKAQQTVIAKYGGSSTSSIVSCSPSNVDEVLCELLDTEYGLYLEHEAKALEQLLQVTLSDKNRYPNTYALVSQALEILQQGTGSTQELTQIAQLLYPLYREVEQSFAQSRRSRAGGSAQYHVEFLLDQLGYKGLYAKQCALNGTVDFLFPSKEMWQKDRRRCTILSVKRSLRERYKQIFEELGLTRGLTIYLLVSETYEEAEKDITVSKVDSLNQQNVYLVVRERVKQRFQDKANVLGFNQFFCEELPRLKSSWGNSENP